MAIRSAKNILSYSLNVASDNGGTVVCTSANTLPSTNNIVGTHAFTEDTNKLYIWNGAAWVNIALINTNPTITQGADATYALATDGTPTVITLAATDPEGIPVTWSYSVTTGSLTNGGGATATVTQNGNEFTVTPSTNTAYAGGFELTFTASDGVNIATSVSSFDLSFGPTTIGEAYGGGYYAGKIVQGGSTYYLIVAPKSSGENSSKQWKTSNDAGPAATQTLNNGPAASSSMNSATYPAAQFCEGLSIGGYTDWYLPSRDELELCYRNLKPTTNANSTSARSTSAYTYPDGNDVPGDTMGINRNSDPIGAAYTSGSPAQTSVSSFQTGNSEAFAVGFYWSSSEYSSTYAWAQFSNNGGQYNFSKDGSYYVRAVRRIPV